MNVRAYLVKCDITFSDSQLDDIELVADDVIEDLPFTLQTAKKTYDQLSIPQRAIFLTLLSSGARINEVLNIRLQDIFWDETPCRVTLPICKGGKSRDVFISNEAKEYLQTVWLPRREAYIETKDKRTVGLRNRRSQLGTKTTNPFPYNIRLFPLDRNTVQEALRRGVIAAGLESKTSNGITKLHIHSTGNFLG